MHASMADRTGEQLDTRNSAIPRSVSGPRCTHCWSLQITELHTKLRTHRSRKNEPGSIITTKNFHTKFDRRFSFQNLPPNDASGSDWILSSPTKSLAPPIEAWRVYQWLDIIISDKIDSAAYLLIFLLSITVSTAYPFLYRLNWLPMLAGHKEP